MDLFKKYNVQVPRYTSYPTVPFWNKEAFATNIWLEKVSHLKGAISLYLHMPFCESLCTFCACHKRITKNHAVEEQYVESLLKEWWIYTSNFKNPVQIAELHLGGGTPSFFSPSNLDKLLQGIFSMSKKAKQVDFSWEGHPNNTSYQHLEVFYKHGFKRVSFGVQDYNAQVQKAIHRIQPFKNVENVSKWAKEIGYTSISHDLVFGLPFQTLSSVKESIYNTLLLKPERISFYSYAHVPWLKGNGQRGFNEDNLPQEAEKRELYLFGKKMLEKNGYLEIGMDHFALETDALAVAYKNGTLHRNFMGYTTQKTDALIGLGASSISEIPGAYAQNEKRIEEYQNLISIGMAATVKGHFLTEKDKLEKQKILDVMCNGSTKWIEISQAQKEMLVQFQEDGLIQCQENSLRVTENGMPFLRNVASIFDSYLVNKPQTRVFSTSI